MARGIDRKSELKGSLSDLQVSPSQSRGQNFLHDGNAISTVINFALLSGKENLVEVGPGLGALTKELVRAFQNLTVVEVEPQFAENLRKTLPPTCKVIEQDVLMLRLSDLSPDKFTVISNVPYSISTDFSLWLFENSASITRASLLLQREFAERLGAEIGTRNYGSLTVLRARYASAELGPVIAPTAFHPQPRVDSRLISLDFLRPEIDLAGLDSALFEEFVRACFRQKRKTIINNLSNSKFFETKAQVKEFLAENSLPETIRAEEISPQLFVQLCSSYSVR